MGNEQIGQIRGFRGQVSRSMTDQFDSSLEHDAIDWIGFLCAVISCGRPTLPFSRFSMSVSCAVERRQG